MSADIKGTAVVWSTGGITFTAGIAGGSMVQSLNYGTESELTELKDTTGIIAAMVFHGYQKRVSMSVIPTGASIAAAVVAKETYLPSPGTAVTIADASGAGNQVDQNWIVVTATENRTVDGVVTIDLELENAEADISASASA